MGFDLFGAGKAATSLLGTDGTNQNSLPMNASKSVWSTQLVGLYSLIYPNQHKDYPNRDEVNMAIKQAFKTHDSTNMHNGYGSSPGNTNVQDAPLIPREKTYSTGATPSKATNLETQQASSMESVNTTIIVKADSTVQSYGV